MTHQEFNQMLEKIIEVRPGTVTSSSLLAELPGWDSLAVLVFIAEVDVRFQQDVSGKELADCVTAADLATLLGNHIAG